MDTAVIEAENVTRHFLVTKGLLFPKEIGRVRAVDGISFSLAPGETLGIVGESGCGKTTTSRMLLGLDSPTSGTIRFNGRKIDNDTRTTLSPSRLGIQAVFQDPWSSLNPRMIVRDIVAEAITVRSKPSKREIEARVAELLTKVGLDPSMASRYPHQFSGGQRQRIAIAAALAPDPKLIVLDEPVSALDVSVRAQVMNLLKSIQEQSGVAYVIIAHNLATVRYMAHQIAVMYLGQFVEYGPTETLFSKRLHPYTQALLAASLSLHPDDDVANMVIKGETPSPINPPAGCRFHTRCPFTMDKCRTVEPAAKHISDGYRVACHLV
ncbi:ABC transporter ATP-binding protein [Pseudochelatococcus sp. B33]